MATQQETTKKLDLRTGEEDKKAAKERVFAMNLGGESGAVGNPVVISPGLHVQDAAEHDRMLRANPPVASVPAQDPTPYKDATEGEVPTGTVRDYPAQGGPAEVRRVDDRTPDSAIATASRPYNLDASAAQVSKLTGRDAAEETAEGKHMEGGVKAKVADDLEEEQEKLDEVKKQNARAQRENAKRGG